MILLRFVPSRIIRAYGKIATESDLKEAVALYQTLPGTIRLSLFLESSNSSTNATQPNFAESIQDLLRNVLGGAGVSAGTPPANFFAHLAGMFKPGDDVSPTDLFANLSAMLNNPALEAHLEELSNVFKEGSCKGPSQKEQCPGSFCESGKSSRFFLDGFTFRICATDETPRKILCSASTSHPGNGRRKSSKFAPCNRYFVDPTWGHRASFPWLPR